MSGCAAHSGPASGLAPCPKSANAKCSNPPAISALTPTPDMNDTYPNSRRGGLSYSALTETFLAFGRIDFAARFCWLLDPLDPLANAGGANDFVPNITRLFHIDQRKNKNTKLNYRKVAADRNETRFRTCSTLPLQANVARRPKRAIYAKAVNGLQEPHLQRTSMRNDHLARRYFRNLTFLRRRLGGFVSSFGRQWPFRRAHQLQILRNDASDVLSLKSCNDPRNGFDCKPQMIRDVPAGHQQ